MDPNPLEAVLFNEGSGESEKLSYRKPSGKMIERSFLISEDEDTKGVGPDV